MDVFAQGIDHEPCEPSLIHMAKPLGDHLFEGLTAFFIEDGLYWTPASPDQTIPIAVRRCSSTTGIS